MKRIFLGLLFILWIGFVLSAFYLVQKPLLLTVVRGLSETIWIIGIWLLLVIIGLGIGEFFISKVIKIDLSAVEGFILDGGVGLGILGLVGFFLGVCGWTSFPILLCMEVVFLFLFRNELQRVFMNLRETFFVLRIDVKSWPLLLKIYLFGSISLSFILALSPPGTSFDALAYHLVAPEKIIQDGGVIPYDHVQFWFPGLPEGLFLLVIGMKAVRAAQLLHLTWAFLSFLLIWYWTKTVWNSKVAQTTVLIILSMPSLVLLASWAYTDFTLAYFGLASLYCVYRGFELRPGKHQNIWIILSGIFSGMAMGVKYTSFLIPITVLGLIVYWNRKNLFLAARQSILVGFVAVLVASPWYMRNWLVMGNPFYPFIFNGLYWDTFRANWYASSGSGIGFNIRELILLPLNAILGHRDANYYDGRIGPLFLVLAPFTLYGLKENYDLREPRKVKTLLTIIVYCAISFGVWVIGVMNSSALWQTRLLYPSLIAFSLPTALGMIKVKACDSPKLKVSFITQIFVYIVAGIALVDGVIFVVQQNPIPYVIGLSSDEDYLRQVQPSYASAVELVNASPQDANLYMLYEPRSYYMDRRVQSDAILDNLAHDLYLYGNPDTIIKAWRDAGYTHVLLNRQGLNFLMEMFPVGFSKDMRTSLDDTINSYLELLTKTEDGSYELYAIPYKK